MGLREGADLFAADGREACLSFRVNARIAVALGPPVGPATASAGVFRDFRRWCSRRGLRAALCGLPGEHAASARAAGFDITPAGDEAIVDPRRVDLRGKSWREVRAALNRARSRNLSFRWLSLEERIARQSEVDSVSEAWLQGKALPELRFALGSGASILDPRARVGVAEDAAGRLMGFATWVPASGGWMLELLRYRPGAMAGLADYLVASSLLQFRDEGCAYASLSGTPLANVTGETPWAKAALSLLRWSSRPAYNFEGLRLFKQKFNPTWEPLYVAHTGHFGLARASVAILRACLPEGGLAASAGLALNAVKEAVAPPRVRLRRVSYPVP